MYYIVFSEVKKMYLNYFFNFCDVNINVFGVVEEENVKVVFLNIRM